ncbi:MAG: hypothetical protein HC905_04525 [Bacteroidales bacterium]|nr:hypothetical protein [Bacteroidales bacterium]
MAFATGFSIKADEKSFNEAMAATLEKMKTAAVASDFNDVANQFERIAKAEQNQWLPYYYAAYASIIQSFVSQDKTKTDLVLDYAEKMINEAINLKGEESENFVIQGFLYCARIVVDPNTRGAQYSQMAIASFKKAQALNPENPRADYMMGMVLLNTPDFYGGGKKVAQPILEGAIQKYEKFVPLTEMHPVWGKEDCQKQLELCK